jgi:chromosome segregation ATPase
METTKLLQLIKPIAIIILVLALGGYVFRSCNLTDENSKLRGIIEVKDTLLKEQEEKTALAKEAYEKTLASKDLEALHWQEIADKNAAVMATGNSKIKDLKEQLAKLNPAEKDAIILTQKALIETLEGNLTLAYSTIEAKDKIIIGWQGAFKKWDTYRVELETENAQLHSLIGTQKDLVSRLEKDLRWSKAQGKIKNIVLAGTVGYIAYSVVQGMVKK